MKLPRHAFLVLSILYAGPTAGHAQTRDISLSPLTFEELAPGVWRGTQGRTEDFDLRAVGGGEPRVEAMDRLPHVPFPLDDRGAGVVRGRSTKTRTALRFPLLEGEEIYGLGLDFKRVVQNGQIQTLRVDHWGDRSGRTHAPVPMYVSSQGYAVLIDSARYMTFYVGTALRRDSMNPPPVQDRNRDDDWKPHPRADSIEVHVPAAGATVYVFSGPSALQAVQRYVLFQGGGALPPKWGLGFTHRTPTRYTADQLRAEVAEFEERGFPLDFIGVEPGWHSNAYPCSFEWDAQRFPDPKSLIEELGRGGVRVNLWMNPYVYPEAPLHEELETHGSSHHVWNGLIGDFEVPEARTIFSEHLDRVTVGIGVSGFKIDEVDGFDRWLWPDTAFFPSGLDAEQIRQTYGLRLQRMVDGLYRGHDRRTWGLVRASNGFGARFPFVIYNDHYSHREFITALVNSSFTGLLWTPEVRSSKSGEEWLRRMQTVCMSPMAMLNAWASGTKPWSFPEVEDEVREISTLRMRLLPYLYTAFARYRFEGIPPVRAMPLVRGFAEVGTAKQRRAALKTQFVVGDDLLVAPLFAGETERDVLFPRGTWHDFHTGAAVDTKGGRVHIAPEDKRLPLYVRGGALIPLIPPRLHAPGPQETLPLEVRVYGNAPAARRIYDDDGHSFAFERDERAWGVIRVRSEGHELRGEIETIGARALGYAPVEYRLMTPAERVP